MANETDANGLLIGRAEINTVDGNTGNLLNGTNGDDTLDGRGGNDTLRGRDGADVLLGGTGRDVINPGDNDASVGDFIDGGLGNDTINFKDIVIGFVTLGHNDLDSDGQTVTVNIDGVANTGSVVSSGGEMDTLLNVANPLNAGWTTGGLSVVGTSGDDTFNINVGFQQWMQVRGGMGNDVFNVTGVGPDSAVRVDYSDTGAINADLNTGVVMHDGFTDQINGQIWELRGSNGTDVMRGSNADESFVGRSGDDTIDGRGGFDRVRYDRGGNDSAVTVDLATGTATGSFNGNAFTHTLENIEWVRGSRFNDTLLGDGNANFLQGRDGNDTLNGRNGNDTLDGEQGSDRLIGGNGDDLLRGGDGEDTLLGGKGNDDLSGGDGDDSLNPGDNIGGLTGFDIVSGGLGSDTIDFSQIVTGWVALNHDVQGQNAQSITVQIDGVANTGTITASNGDVDTLINVKNPLNSGFTTGGLSVRGTDESDTFNVHTDADQWMEIRGNGGDDTFNITGDGLVRIDYSRDGAAVVNLKNGTATHDGFTDTINGQVFEVRGSNFADRLLGSSNDDRFIGRSGDDTINGRDGFDLARYDRVNMSSAVNVNLAAETATGEYSGVGFTHTLLNIEAVRGSFFNDTLAGDKEDNLLQGRTGNDNIRGRGGNDTLAGEDGRDTLRGDNGKDSLDGGDGRDLLRGGNDNDTLLGGSGKDTLRGDDGRDLLRGGNDNDTLDGGTGNDTLRGDNGNDLLRGGNNNDRLTGGSGKDTLEGGSGNDLLVGSGGNDDLEGGKGQDTLRGGSGADTLEGGEGNDTLRGDGGADTFQFEAGIDNGTDTVTDFENGTDVIAIEGVQFSDLTITQAGSDTTITWANGSVVLEGETGTIDANDFVFF